MYFVIYVCCNEYNNFLKHSNTWVEAASFDISSHVKKILSLLDLGNKPKEKFLFAQNVL